MDLALMPAVAAASGGMSAAVITWVTQRRKDHTRRTRRAISQRQKLYKEFIEEASRLYADALTNDGAEIAKLVGMYALIGRMKIISSDQVNEAAEKAARSIMQAYLSPNKHLSISPKCSKKSTRCGISVKRAAASCRQSSRAEDKTQCQ